MSASIAERRTCCRSPPPTASLKSTSPEKHASPLTTNATWSSLARSRQRFDAQAARLQRPVDGDTKPREHLAVARNVVGVGVRRQQMRDLDPFPLDSLEQRLQGGARVHEDRGSAGLVRHQIGVRQPPGMHAPLDEHRPIG